MSKLYKRRNSPFYWYVAHIKGQRIRVSTGISKQRLAEKVQDEWDLMLAKGDTTFVRKNFHTLETKSHIRDYISFLESRKTKNTVVIAKGVLNKLKAYLSKQGIKMLSEVQINHIDGYIDSIKVSPKTKKNHLIVISLMFKQAVREGDLVQNPCEYATLPQITTAMRHRPLTADDLEVIFKNANNWELYFAALLYTGLRAGDVALLRYEQIDSKNKRITQLVRKSRRIHELPISDVLLSAFGDIDGKEGPVFPELYIESDRKQNDRLVHPRKYLQSILSAAELPKATLHSFRVTYNNMLRDQGLSIQDRQVLMAHTSSETTKIYTHPNIELAAKHLNKMPNYLDKSEK
ncbi:MAG: tyrosine-type recombinase/integrase [Candidatus Marinimicrobia bacterium]|nr:tyrosine-type recombinase/integrase [Candidatus Neomarinimicrobiota bacterium]